MLFSHMEIIFNTQQKTKKKCKPKRAMIFLPCVDDMNMYMCMTHIHTGGYIIIYATYIIRTFSIKEQNLKFEVSDPMKTDYFNLTLVFAYHTSSILVKFRGICYIYDIIHVCH